MLLFMPCLHSLRLACIYDMTNQMTGAKSATSGGPCSGWWSALWRNGAGLHHQPRCSSLPQGLLHRAGQMHAWVPLSNIQFQYKTQCWNVAVLQERLFDQSDAYRVHVCEKSGLIAVANLKKQQFSSQIYKADSNIVQVRLVMHLFLKALCLCLACASLLLFKRELKIERIFRNPGEDFSQPSVIAYGGKTEYRPPHGRATGTPE